MEFPAKSLAELPTYLRIAFKLARTHRSESGRILRRAVLAIVPLLAVLLIVLGAVAVLSGFGHGTQLAQSHPKFSIGAALLGVAVVIAFCGYLVWLLYHFARCAEAAMKLGLATVDGNASIGELKRGWALVRLTILLAIPTMIAKWVFRSAGIGSLESSLITAALFSVLFLAVPAVIEIGAAVQALRKSWLLMGTHTVFLFACGLISLAPAIIRSLLGALPGPAAFHVVIVVILFVAALLFDFQYAPFFVALVYRAVSPREEVSIQESEDGAVALAESTE